MEQRYGGWEIGCVLRLAIDHEGSVGDQLGGFAQGRVGVRVVSSTGMELQVEGHEVAFGDAGRNLEQALASPSARPSPYTYV